MPQHHQTDNDTGLTPVPVAVILPPTHPSHRHQPPAPGPAHAGVWSPTTVGLLVATYTRAGDLIVNPHADATITRVAAWLDRRTTTLLTHRHRHPASSDPQPGDGRGFERAALVLDLPPRLHHGGLDARRLRGWIELRRDALSRRGFLLVAVEAHSTRVPYVDRATPLITATRTAGLIYHQHLVVVHTRLTEPENDRGHEVTPRQLVEGRHAAVHTDVYAFTTGDIDE